MKNSILNCSLVLFVLCVLVRPVWSGCIDLETQLQISNNDNGFQVTYFDSYKIVKNIRANENYVLYCTSQPPNDTSLPENIKGFFQIPVKNVASLDQTTITYLEILGVESTLKYVADRNSITSPCLQNSSIIQTFNESSGLENVDIVFTTSTSLKGSKYVTISLSDDLSPLSNAEWIKFISVFFNSEKKANNAYSHIESVYNCNTNNLNNIPQDSKMSIAWVSYNFSNSSFTISGKTIIVSDLKDLHNIIDKVDFIIDQTEFSSSNNTFDNWQHIFGYHDITSNIPIFITYRRVFRPQKILNEFGFDDWTEKFLARPDFALLDLISIQYPQYQSSYSKIWLNNFSNEDEPIILTDADCADYNNSTTTSFVESGLAGFGSGIWLLLWARRKYEERFVELKDEPEVQMDK
ncbi:11322_t:CDS:2 [Diversispora eburnea]|uniref:11322_t:CDS:1 n=1 Tax=Diversispora eburnea TaxID=1213867 RepID=A0A9N9B3R7_9GLOM|nr:11322_t:CDS:2 [Diversispora eburnea]